jgi:hypothetical protein
VIALTTLADHKVYLIILSDTLLLLRVHRVREALLSLLVIKLKPEKYHHHHHHHHRDRLFEVEEGKNIKQGMANETSL